jgi:hypothetical protein
VDYLAGLLQGDLGTSIRYQVPVGEVIAERLPRSLLLMGTALCSARDREWPPAPWRGGGADGHWTGPARGLHRPAQRPGVAKGLRDRVMKYRYAGRNALLQW